MKENTAMGEIHFPQHGGFYPQSIDIFQVKFDPDTDPWTVFTLDQHRATDELALS
jgi:hypothetical protein